MQWFFIMGSAVVLVSALAFIVVSFIATLRTGKVNTIHTYVFFAVSMLLFALLLFEWRYAFGFGGQSIVSDNVITSQDTLSQWLVAIGTLALAAVTAGIVAVPMFLDWRKRPRFKVDFDKKDCRKATLPQDSYWLRLKVKNSGKSVARRCIGKIVKFVDDSGERTDLDPVMLHWVGTPWDTPKPPFFTTIDLNRDEPALLDILVTKRDSSQGQSFVFTYDLIEAVPKDILNGNGQIQVTIYGDDVVPFTREYSIIWDNPSDYTSIRLE